MKNKKGVELMGRTVVNFVVAAIVVVILVYFVIKTYIVYSENNELKKAEKVLNEIKGGIELVKEQEGTSEISIFPPIKWFLKTFPNNDFPEGECKRVSDCLCVCEDAYCEKRARKCLDFNFEVRVKGTLKGIGIPDYEKGGFYYTNPITEIIELENSIEEIIISEDKGVIRISRNEEKNNIEK